MRKQKGFNLIELMIVVAVLGVLASVAVPVYFDYLLRSKVSEAVRLLGALKNPMIEYYYFQNEWPTSPAVVGGKSLGAYTSYIFSGGDEPDYYVEAVMKGTLGSTGIAGRSLRMTYNTLTRDWECVTVGVLGDPIPAKYLPSPCKPGF